MTPRAYISYSWSSPSHRSVVVEWAERLVADGVDVVLDVWDLKEGHDKYAFMERMTSDESITHVLVFSDAQYAKKADERAAGVGTESQIISKEVYEKVEQSKFLPIVCEFDESGRPYLPVFLASRIWIDFSTPEAVNTNWEQLVRVLYGKPSRQKPEVGKTPLYISEEVRGEASPAIAKFSIMRQAARRGEMKLSPYRTDFLDAVVAYADGLRVREKPDLATLGARVVEDCGRLRLVRNQIVDWVLLESQVTDGEEFSEQLLSLLERLLELKSRPAELTSWNDSWFDAEVLFVYETFLYVVAALVRAGGFGLLHEVLTSHYLAPETSRLGGDDFVTFDEFYGYSQLLQGELAPEGRTLYAPAAELVKRQADRDDLPLPAVVEADLIVFMMSLISGVRWYPQMLHYTNRERALPLFTRAAQHKHFRKLALITGIDDADELRAAIHTGLERAGVAGWSNFAFTSFAGLMNLDKLDTIT